MTLTIAVWHVLGLLTLVGWGVLIAWPVPGSRGDYDFGPAFTCLARFVVAVCLTLVVWLVYFAGRVVFG